MEGGDDFYLLKSFRGKGAVYIMSGVDRTASDYADLLSIGYYFAKRGSTVKILAPTHYKDPLYHKFFGALIGTVYFRKCPDLLIDGEFYEYESYIRPFKSQKISHMIKRGAEQAGRIIIDNNKGASDRFIINMILKRLNDKNMKNEIHELYVYEKGAVRLLFRNKKAVGSKNSPRSTNP